MVRILKPFSVLYKKERIVIIFIFKEVRIIENILGDRIKERRKIKRLSGASLAEEIGISQRMISCYETGTKKPSTKTLEKLSEILEVSIDYLMGRTDEPGSTTLNPSPIQLAGRARRAESLSKRAADLREDIRFGYAAASPQDRLLIKSALQAALADISDTEFKEENSAIA